MNLEPPRYKLRIVHPAGVVYAEAWEFDDEIRADFERIAQRIQERIKTPRPVELHRADFAPEAAAYGKWAPIE